MSGQIILPPVQPTSQLAPTKMVGSPITAAADKVAGATQEQAKAVNALGGKMTAGRRRLRGGAEIEVKNIPNLPSAGGSNHANVLANLLEVKAQHEAQSQYDSLGSAPPMTVGGKRRSRKHNARRKTKHARKHRRTSHKHIGIHRSRRRVQFRK